MSARLKALWMARTARERWLLGVMLAPVALVLVWLAILTPLSDMLSAARQRHGEAVEALALLDIQYHVLVDLKGFRSLVDAVGGLDITVQRRTPIGSEAEIRGWIEAGEQHLDGHDALWYARSRARCSSSRGRVACRWGMSP